MKWFLYNALFAVVYVAALPFFLVRMKRRGGYRARMGDRFGFYPRTVREALARLDAPVWVHAVSVGEVQVAAQLMREMRARDPSVRFVFSTTSSTGWKTAQGEIAAGDVLVYNPLDFPGCVRRAFAAVRPRALVLAETELWPNFIRAAARRGVPVFLVNARVSDRSAPRYRALRWFFGDVLRTFAKIWAQSALDRERLVAAGADPAAVVASGSVKFDVARRNPAKEKELRTWIGEGPVLLGASTWPGEDAVLLGVYRKLLATRPDVRLVLAPRHFEKADAVERNVRAAGFACVRRSRGDVVPKDGAFVCLCDTTGELMGLYGLAQVSFVGKSLCAHGSQNMIEPCLCANATLVGPNTENFRPVMRDLLAAEALVQVPDAVALEREILHFFADESARAALGARAAAAVAARRGLTARCAAEILGIVKASDVSRGKGKRFPLRWIAAALVLVWALAACCFTPSLRHGWRMLRLDPNRRYAAYLALSAASAPFPWVWSDARKALAGIRDVETPGTDEFGVVRFASTTRLSALVPKLFPKCPTRAFDARFRALCEMKRVHDECVAAWGGYRLWAVGRYDYVFVAKCAPGATNETVSADYVTSAFSARFEEFAAAGVYAPAQLFACYVGDDRETAGAFASCGAWDRFLVALLPNRLLFKPDLAGGCAQVRGSYLVGVEGPSFAWLVRGALSPRVHFDFTEHVASVQHARRRMLGAFDLADAGGASATNALALWAASAADNPCDPLLRNLADVLDLQGRRFLAVGNVNGALRCYQNRLEVFPGDVAAIHNFGTCLQRAGHAEQAARVFSEAARRDPANEEHLLEFVTSAAAAGHEEDALRVLENLIKKHPDEPKLKIRAAKIRSFLYNRNVRENRSGGEEKERPHEKRR